MLQGEKGLIGDKGDAGSNGAKVSNNFYLEMKQNTEQHTHKYAI
jgi:hypothetical protein